MILKMLKVFSAIVLAFVLSVGFIGLSATNTAFAAGRSSNPSIVPSRVNDRVPGWCNWDNDQDQDDWCWTNSTVTATQSSGVYTSTNGTVYPYGAVIGQIDAGQDMNGYNNNSSNSSNSYNNGYQDRYYLYRPGRMGRLALEGRLFRRNGSPAVVRNGKVRTAGKWWCILPLGC